MFSSTSLSANLRAELFVSTRFRSAIYEPDLRQSHYPTLYRRAPLRFFLAFFCISPHPSSTFSRARPAFKFCRFARSIRSGYERTCTQTPSLRALFTRRCARILSKFFVEFQTCLHPHSRRGHKRSLLRTQTKYLRDTAREIKFKRYLVKVYLSRCGALQNFKMVRAAI